MASWRALAKKWIPGPLFIVGLTAMSLPVGYIIKKHIDWKKNPDAKKRMLIHHLVFWGASVPALKSMHIGWGELKVLRTNYKKFPYKHLFKGAGYLLGAAGALIGAFEGGDRLARKLVPKPPKPTAPPLLSAAPPVFSMPPSETSNLQPLSGIASPIYPIGARPYTPIFSVFR